MADENQTPQNQGNQQPQPAPQPTPETSAQPAAPQAPTPAPAQPAPAVPAQPQEQPAPAPQVPAQEQQPVQPAQPTPQQPQPKAVPTTPAKPAPVKPGVKPTPIKPGQKPTRKPPNPRRLIWGCTGCSGIALFFFIILVLVFVAQTTSAGQNPLAQSLGVSTASLTRTLILLVNLIFGAISLGMFVLATIGGFRFFMARKDDKVARNKGLTMAGVSSALLIFFVFIWIGIYLFMTSRQVAEIRASGIVTEPAETTQLTAPINIVFDGSSLPTNTNQYEILSYLWNFGDGNTSTVPLTSNTYTDKGDANGRFDVSLQVTKRDRSTGEESIDTYSRIVTIANVELGAIFTATPDRGPAPLTVQFDASDSMAPAGNIVSYEWDFNNDNVFTDASGVQVSETFEQIGTYKVNLRVTDNTGQFKIESKDIIVSGENQPVAVIDIPTETGQYFVGQQYSFRGENSSSPTGSISSYKWNFGDGSSNANTRTATHVYSEAGTYEVVLTVTDQEGITAESTQSITIEIPESAPIASIETVPAPNGDGDDVVQGTVPLEIAFDASGSQDPDNNIVDYKWDFDGDGTEDAAGQQTTFVYKESGVFNATLTVTDSENNESKAVIVVRASSQPLQARVTANPVEGVVPLTVTFDASSSSYPTGQIVSYEWDFGDGSAKRIDVAQVTYKYTKIGTFTASVTAIASDNTRSTTEIPINVRPVPLTACFSALPESGQAPLEVEFDPNCSSGTVASYSWDFGDGSSTKTRKPTHVFNTPGSYSVVLEVADNQNVIDTFTKNILVTGSL
ncbi:MAG: PKD domain-containing protein [Candidatus Gracilibacteria bacterium]